MVVRSTSRSTEPSNYVTCWSTLSYSADKVGILLGKCGQIPRRSGLYQSRAIPGLNFRDKTHVGSTIDQTPIVIWAASLRREPFRQYNTRPLFIMEKLLGGRKGYILQCLLSPLRSEECSERGRQVGVTLHALIKGPSLHLR